MKKRILFTLLYIPLCFAAPHEAQPYGAHPSQTMQRVASTHSEDTGYDSHTPASSQSSVHVEIGTPLEDFAPQTPVFFDEGQMDDDDEPEDELNGLAPIQRENREAAQPTLVDDIDYTYHNTPPLWAWTEPEVSALGHLKGLAFAKRIFKNHIQAWVRKNFRIYLDVKRSTALVNTLSEMIDNSENDYWERKRIVLHQLRTTDIPEEDIYKFDTKVLVPHERKCKDRVAVCAQLMGVFSEIEGVPLIQRRQKLLPNRMIRTALQNITHIVNGHA